MNFVSKSWGAERWVVNNDKYCGKVLFFAKGRSCSLHYHKLKEETFYVQSGKLKLQYYNFDNNEGMDAICLDSHSKGYSLPTAEIILEAGDKFDIPIGMRHRMTGLLDTVMFEFSTTHFDSDSYRIIPS